MIIILFYLWIMISFQNYKEGNMVVTDLLHYVLGIFALFCRENMINYVFESNIIYKTMISVTYNCM